MTKKDYKLIANALKDTLIELKQFNEIPEFLKTFVNILSIDLLKDNPNFNKNKFEEAIFNDK